MCLVFPSFVDGRMTAPSRRLFDLVAPESGRTIGQISEAGVAGVVSGLYRRTNC
jgi:hypothetical protein